MINMAFVNSEKGVRESILMKFAMIWRPANQLKHVKNNTPKSAKGITRKKVAGLEVNVVTTTVNSMMTLKPVNVNLQLTFLKR